MIYAIVRKETEINKLLDACQQQEDEGGSKFRGMSYEQGLKDGIDWLTNKDASWPLE